MKYEALLLGRRCRSQERECGLDYIFGIRSNCIYAFQKETIDETVGFRLIRRKI